MQLLQGQIPLLQQPQNAPLMQQEPQLSPQQIKEKAYREAQSQQLDATIVFFISGAQSAGDSKFVAPFFTLIGHLIQFRHSEKHTKRQVNQEAHSRVEEAGDLGFPWCCQEEKTVIRSCICTYLLVLRALTKLLYQ